MEATTPETYAVLDGAYWLDATDGDRDRAPCVHCALLHRSPAPDAPREPGRDGADQADEGQDGLLDRLQTAITCGNAGRLRAVMLTCSLGTVIVGAAATIRR
ncbi:hypothetical protein ACTVZO_03315 [Streptomyces sp. IBSNAI002]|uniref:hypothetical protein n=1 Tax=Streptomyces sp. IBSNAI002 TaxID=3457500 RepID=UPI003FD5C1F7